MKNYVFTGFDEKYWSNWGSSWVYSLREVANYEGDVIVVDCGLSDATRNKLVEKEVAIIKSDQEGDVKKRTFVEIANYSKKNKGNFVYWDADVFFESRIEEIFKEVEDKILLSKNKNGGFIGAPYYQWVFMNDVLNFMKLTKQKDHSAKLIGCLTENFDRFVKYVSNTWNFINLNQISENKIEVDEEKPIVIHPTGNLKYILEHKGFLFHERKNEGYLKFIESKPSIGVRKLLKKSSQK